MTKKQIILETVEYYKNNPRSILKNGKCLYNGPKGAHCAFSRCCLKSALPFLKEEIIASCQIDIQKKLKTRYRGHSADFWNDIQAIHDNKSYWRGKTFTKKGEAYVEILLKQYV